jgi:flavin-dependent dehydrogenase
MDFDIAIIGGGPAGSTAATLLRRRGWKVVICERETFPRFKIGESLLPHSIHAFDILGVRAKLEAHAFPKLGGEIATSCGRRIKRFYFENAIQLRDRLAYQVERAWFDKMLLEHAVENGVELRQPCVVEQINFDADGAKVKTSTGEIRAKYVLDCSGRNAVIGQQHDLRKRYDHLLKFSVFAHYEGAQRDEGRDGTLTRLIRGRNHWFWMIPLDAKRTSVGLVCDQADFKAAKKSPEQALDDAIAESPLMRERMQHAQRLTEVHAVGDYSYRNTRLHGDRWLLAGDAAGFIDPIFSTGVFLAIHSAEQAANAIDTALRRPWLRSIRFAWYARRLNSLMNRYLRFVSAWYTDEFVDVFTTPKPPLQIPQAVNSVLGGNIHPSFSVWWRLQLFYLVLWVQKRKKIVPTLDETIDGPAAPSTQAV